MLNAAVPRSQRVRPDETRTKYPPGGGDNVRGCERGDPERGDEISPEHPAQVVPDLPESRQAVSAPTHSFPEVSFSILNTKSKKPTNNTQISCSQISAWWKEDVICFGSCSSKSISFLIYSRVRLSCLSLSQSNPASDSCSNTSDSFHLITIFSKVKPLWETLKMEITF